MMPSVGADREDLSTVRPDGHDLPPITVAVLNFNRPAEAERTIRSVLDSDYPSDRLHVLLLDNASTDGSAELIEGIFGDRIEILRNHPNIGPVARNRALLGAAGTYVFMFDEDCYPESSQTLRKAVEFLESEPGFGALCFCCVNRRTGMVEFGHPGNAFRTTTEDGTWDGVYVIGGGMAFRSASIEGIEGYDERLRFGGEEYDLAMELIRARVAIAFRRDLRIVHDEAVRAEPPIRSRELDMRNNIWISFRRFPLLISPIIASLHITRRVLSALRAGNRTQLRGYLRGIRSAVARLPEFLATRRPVTYRQLYSYRYWFLQMFLSRPLFGHRAGADDENVDRS